VTTSLPSVSGSLLITNTIGMVGVAVLAASAAGLAAGHGDYGHMAAPRRPAPRSSMASTPIAGQTPRQGTSMGSGDRQLCETPAAQALRAALS
jgi:hypothetical protein